MVVRSEGGGVGVGVGQLRIDKLSLQGVQVVGIQRAKLQVWFITICSGILIWTSLVQLFAVGHLWHPHLLSEWSSRFTGNSASSLRVDSVSSAPHILPPIRNYTSNGFLKVSCNGGLNQMRAAICDMVAIARLLNVTLVVPELDKKSFWADPSDFEDIFDMRYFVDSLRDEVRIIKRLPKKYTRKHGYETLVMPPVSWSNEKYYLEQILPLYRKYKVIHFNKTDTRLNNNGISLDIQKLRCRVNFQALKFTPDIEALGQKLVRILKAKGPFLALHLRYEMDMLAFSGCTHGCTVEEAEELKRMRYAFPWWREKEIISELKRSEGRCPLTPEEAALTLKALGFENDTQIYIASGEIYGSERRLAALRTAFPKIVNKEMLLKSQDLKQFQNHSSQMAALDFIVSLASNTYVPTYDGNMARLVEGHRRYHGYKTTVQLNRKKLVELFDLHQNGTLSWDEFSIAVKTAHDKRMGQPAPRIILPDKPKEEDYFYTNPVECLCQEETCNDVLNANKSTLSRKQLTKKDPLLVE